MALHFSHLGIYEQLLPRGGVESQPDQAFPGWFKRSA